MWSRCRFYGLHNSHKPGRSDAASVAILTRCPAGTLVRFTTVNRLNWIKYLPYQHVPHYRKNLGGVLREIWAPFQYPISLEAAIFIFRIVRSFWDLTGTLAAELSMYVSNFKAMWLLKLRVLRIRDFARSYDKTSLRILKRGPGTCFNINTVCFQYRDRSDFHYKDKMVVRTSYFINGNYYTDTGNTAS